MSRWLSALSRSSRGRTDHCHLLHWLQRESRRQPLRWRRVFLEALEDRALLADITWIAAGGGAFNVASNWSPAQVPSSADNAIIALDGTYTVTATTSHTVASLSLGASIGTQALSISAGTFQITATSTVNNNGVLNLSGGTLTGSGELTVSG